MTSNNPESAPARWFSIRSSRVLSITCLFVLALCLMTGCARARKKTPAPTDTDFRNGWYHWTTGRESVEDIAKIYKRDPGIIAEINRTTQTRIPKAKTPIYIPPTEDRAAMIAILKRANENPKIIARTPPNAAQLAALSQAPLATVTPTPQATPAKTPAPTATPTPSKKGKGDLKTPMATVTPAPSPTPSVVMTPTQVATPATIATPSPTPAPAPAASKMATLPPPPPPQGQTTPPPARPTPIPPAAASAAPAAQATPKAPAAATIASAVPPAQPAMRPIQPAVGPAAAAADSFAWPVKGKVLREFSDDPATPFHGILIGASGGSPVTAARDGKVIIVGEFVGYGKSVVLEHDRGLLTLYSFLDQITVKNHQLIRAGQPVGTVGHPGGAAEAQILFEIRKAAKPINPLLALP